MEGGGLDPKPLPNPGFFGTPGLFGLSDDAYRCPVMAGLGRMTGGSGIRRTYPSKKMFHMQKKPRRTDGCQGLVDQRFCPIYSGLPFFQVTGWPNSGTVEIDIFAEPSTTWREWAR